MLLGSGESTAKHAPWSHDVERHAKKCVGRYFEFANKKIEQFFKVSKPCVNDYLFKDEEFEALKELSKFGTCTDLKR